MVKSIVTILLSTNVVGNTTTETKTVENIDNTKIEETATEEIVEEETTTEEIVEEDIYEWKNEIIAEEIANNPNFEEQYNELLTIYNDYNEIIYYRSPNYMKEQHVQVKDLWRKDWKKQLYAMELDENSILAELKVALLSLVSVDYGDDHCRDLISRINNNL